MPFDLNDDELREASADQREMVRLVRQARTEISKRLSDIGCMNPGEMDEMLGVLDQLIDLHVYAHSLDDRLEFFRAKYRQPVWSE
jgi:uncharacterized radical SAM superfamily protein